MSYDVRLLDPVTKETALLDKPHRFRGCIIILGGTKETQLNITWNYGKLFTKVLGEGGIRSLYGKTGAETVPILENAISQLKDDVSDNYWEPTEGNVKETLRALLTFARSRPDGIWDGD